MYLFKSTLLWRVSGEVIEHLMKLSATMQFVTGAPSHRRPGHSAFASFLAAIPQAKLHFICVHAAYKPEQRSHALH